MIVFLDTSSLIKLYHKEDNSVEIMDKLQSSTKIYLSELASIEFRSAILKKVRTKEILEKDAKLVIALFKDDSAKFNWIKLSSKIVNSASNLLEEFGELGLRTLDSIQLASALVLENSKCLYFTEDKLLLKLFRKLELDCFEVSS